MTTQAERIQTLLLARGVPPRSMRPELARICGVSYQSVREWFTGDTRSIGSDYLGKIAEHWKANLQWLVSGKGSMDAAPPSPKNYALGSFETWDDNTQLGADEMEVPLFKEVEIAAGNGIAAQHQVEINHRKLRFAKSSMRSAGVQFDSAACAMVTGNSMEPKIMDGATIGIDRGRTTVKDGKVFAIDHDGMLRVKYLYRVPGGGLRLHSENSTEHPDEIFGPEWHERIRILGWVFWWSTLDRW